MELFFVGGCHDFLEQTTPENRKKLNMLLKKYKECSTELSDDFKAEIEINIAEIEATPKGLKIKKRGTYNRNEQKRKDREEELEWLN